MSTLQPTMISPTSDQRFWNVLHNRVDSLLQTRNSQLPSSDSSRVKRIKEDSMLLITGFDSIGCTLSKLTHNLDNAIQGTRELAKSSALTDTVHNTRNTVCKSVDNESEKGDDNGEEKKGVKRKLDECSDDQDENDKDEKLQAEKNLKRAKNLAVSMAAKSAFLATELKSVKSDMCFLQERCAFLEEENRRLRNGFEKGIRPDEDDLVRLQLEALLAEKSKLATENSNLTRENQCLRQLVEYHQFASEDLSASYEQLIEGLCLDFSSPGTEDQENGHIADDQNYPVTP